MTFGTWLSDWRARETAEGVDFYELACNPEKLTRTVRPHLADAAEAIANATDHLPVNDDPEQLQRAVWEEHRPVLLAEVGVLLGHIGAVLSLIGCADKELIRHYEQALVSMSRALRDSARICAECKTSVGDDTTNVIVSGGSVYCGKKCEESCNLMPEVSVVAGEGPSGEPEERENP